MAVASCIVLHLCVWLLCPVAKDNLDCCQQRANPLILKHLRWRLLPELRRMTTAVASTVALSGLRLLSSASACLRDGLESSHATDMAEIILHLVQAIPSKGS